MPKHLILLYVDSAAVSAQLYQDLLGRPPVESSSTFAMFALQPSLMLGPWARRQVVPAPIARGDDSELAIVVADADMARAAHMDWSRRKITIAPAPAAMDFGMTLVGLDPDGHRLRVFAPAAP